MSNTRFRIPFHILPALVALCWAANAESITVSGPYPVSMAALKLEDVYGWPITYEGLPLVHESDLRDVTSDTRKDGKSSGEPGVQTILAPHIGKFSFSFEPPSQREAGIPAQKEQTRVAILDMLKSYSISLGGIELFTLTESDGFFHIIPTRRKGVSGAWEKVVPLLDTPVTVLPGRRTAEQLLNEICQSLAAQSGTRVGLAAPSYINLLATRRTQIVSAPGETARSILDRLFADLATPRLASWSLSYTPSFGYGLSMRILELSSKR